MAREFEKWDLQVKGVLGVLKDWNKQVLGNIFVKKWELLQKIKSLDRQLHMGWNNNVVKLQMETWK